MRTSLYFYFALLLFSLLLGLDYFYKNQNRPDKIAARVQKTILYQDGQLKTFLETTRMKLKSYRPGKLDEGIREAMTPNKDNPFVLFIFRNNTLVAWNDNQVSVPGEIITAGQGKPMVKKMSNGWYYWLTQNSDNFLTAGAFLIKRDYSIKNDYLVNDFNPLFGHLSGVELTTKPGPYPIYSSAGEPLCYLEITEIPSPALWFTVTQLVLLVAGFIAISLFIYSFYNNHKWFKNRSYLLFICFLTDLITVRLVQFGFQFPSTIYSTPLFSASWYSSSAIQPSLGDYLLNTIILFILGIVFFIKGSIDSKITSKSNHVRKILGAAALVIIFLLTVAIQYLIGDLILNSAFSLQLQNISGLTTGSLVGILIMLLLFVFYWLVTTRLATNAMRLLTQPGPGQKPHLPSSWLFPLTALMIGIAGYLLVLIITGHHPVLIFASFVVYLFLLWFSEGFGKSVYVFPQIILFAAFFALVATCRLNDLNAQKEHEKSDLFVAKLANWRNPVTEVMFETLNSNVIGDTAFWKQISSAMANGTYDSETMSAAIAGRFFTGFWEKFDVQITICDSVKSLKIQPEGYVVNCDDYFSSIRENYGEETGLPNLFILDYGYGKENYLAVIGSDQLEENSFPRKFKIFIELNLITVGSDPGFPGILIDRENQATIVPSGISYGVYRNNRLIHALGVNHFPLVLEQDSVNGPGDKMFLTEDADHTTYRVDKDTILVICTPKTTWFGWITPFSYLFVLFSMVVMAWSIVQHLVSPGKEVLDSLRNRLYYALMGILIITLLVSGTVQIINILSVNAEKDRDNLRERAASIRVEVQHKFGNAGSPREITVKALDEFLVKLSNIFFTDVHFFNPDGVLMATSRQQIFSKGIISGMMEPEAAQAMMHGSQSIWIHEETIGKMKFLSAYVPLFNESNDLLGYLNLPFFSRGDESKQEIAAFVVTFLNIYIIIFLLGVLLTIVISDRITAPLALLAGKLSKIRLGKSNEKIEWNKNDEIGQLVAEYNRMVDELALSADLLARSERESAWREMARQVAHEIKNPLTPIKLSAQHLEKAWLEKAPDLDHRFRRFTQTLVAQIDALSEIATDFSDFAKLPKMKMESVNIEEVARFVINMYRDALSIKIVLNSENDDLCVSADRAQLIRVFTNLMNNAIQAIGERRDGRIVIGLKQENSFVSVEIMDNGAGIEAAQMNDIFRPGFTTRPGGMGLGLAIVKAILDDFNAEISCRSDEAGTTFRIKLGACEVSKTGNAGSLPENT